MSFFNLNSLGYDKPFQSMKCLDRSTQSISNLNYHNLRRKHVRDEQNSTFHFRKPITEAQKIGSWKNNESWTKIQRYVHPRSEMTKFVDDMALTNPYFSLF